MDTGGFDRVTSIHDMKTVRTGKTVQKIPIFGLEIGLIAPLSHNSQGLLQMHQNNASVEVE